MDYKDSNSIIKRLNEIKDIPTLPIIAMEINRMLESYDTSIEKLSTAIEKDQAIASKVLRLVNSSFFGVRSKVTRIRDAVVLLGFDSVRNIVLSVSLVKAFSGALSQNGFDIADFWRHSINVAMTSKKLSELSKTEEPECCFTSGLLHDSGKIILSQHFSGLFESIMMKVLSENISFTASEKTLTSFGHEKAGGFLSAKWKLPVHLVDVVRFHHTISQRASNMNLVKIVHAADVIAHALTLDQDLFDQDAFNKIRSRMNETVLNDKALGPHLKKVGYWYPELSENIKEANRFFAQNA
ncbi:MAG: HDOD domain-containing protein [Proteobacteria bacterium]|nr:HDOD domain-containing protein [Pseudomonadota bacterium]